MFRNVTLSAGRVLVCRGVRAGVLKIFLGGSFLGGAATLFCNFLACVRACAKLQMCVAAAWASFFIRSAVEMVQYVS